ncbi:hypothetical protein SNE35_31155 [Paucibacter sp. R3-3]|uniref:DUF5678 domain-containing protein n=1 Tax=Roseateles agri TaxID=3098619 RepID=A0ABU5DSZ0_9BURK|nr:hypothetical protein [Paucibacter sp. R3-3]MDY0748998.1 hypothetical protein [Paucibacter sp. R3-3]
MVTRLNLELETRTFLANREFWAREHAGEYVLIHGRSQDFFTTLEKALDEGYRRYGMQFLVKQVTREVHIDRVSPLL